jgi:hypothetical protein
VGEGGGWQLLDAAPTKEKFKKTDFVGTIMSKVLRDLYSSLNQSLNTTDG